MIATTPAENWTPGKGAGIAALRILILSRSGLPAAKTRVGFAAPKDCKGRAVGPVVIIFKRHPTTTWERYQWFSARSDDDVLIKGHVVTVGVDKVNSWPSAGRHDVGVDIVRRN